MDFCIAVLVAKSSLPAMSVLFLFADPAMSGRDRMGISLVHNAKPDTNGQQRFVDQ